MLKICDRAWLAVFGRQVPRWEGLFCIPNRFLQEEIKTAMQHSTCPLLSLCVSLWEHTFISDVSSYLQRFTYTCLSGTFVQQQRGSPCARTPSGPIRNSQSSPGSIYHSSATQQRCVYLSSLFSSPDKCRLHAPPLPFSILLEASNGNDGF